MYNTQFIKIMILIKKWYGRYGNNILQLLNCLDISEKENLATNSIPHLLFSVLKEGNKKNIDFSKNFRECFLGISDKYVYEKNSKLFAVFFVFFVVLFWNLGIICSQ